MLLCSHALHVDFEDICDLCIDKELDLYHKYFFIECISHK